MPRKIAPFIAKKVGNWKGALEFMSQMGYRVKTVTKKEQYAVCKELKERIISHLINQDLNWEPLRPATLKRKNPENADLILIDSELYMKSIALIRDGDFAGVGIKKGAAYRRKGNFTTVDRVANMLEYGTMKMVARPLWNPTLEEMGGAKGIRNRIALAIYHKLQQSSRGTPIRVTKSQIIKNATRSSNR